MKKRSREFKPKPETLILDAVTPGPALIKHLASCSAPVRSKALRLLEVWLLSQSEIADDDMKKLWKGLFYCLWHSDKAPAQSHLINRASSLVLNLDLSLALNYFSVFLVSLKREWIGIDRLRLDKFYLLVRKFIYSIFSLCKKHSWNVELLSRVVDIFINNAFLAEDKLLGNGVCYHIVSVWLDELSGCSVPVACDVVGYFFKPLFEVIKRSEDRVLVGKVKSCVFDKLLNTGKSLLEKKMKGAESNECYAEVALGLISMKMGFSSMFFEIGSSLECHQGNRKIIFKLHDEFLKLENLFETSRVDIVLPKVPIEEEQIPDMVPIENSKTNKGDASDGQTDENSRKCKKAKMMQVTSNKIGKKKEEKKRASQDCSLITETVFAPRLTENSKPSKGKEDSEIALAGETIKDNPVVESVVFTETVISNLQMQFEKVATEVGDGEINKPKIPMENKRRNGKTVNNTESCIVHLHNVGDFSVTAAKSEEKRSKKVRFAMKNNLVWKPHCPLPPQSLRLPPSSTPRGSALKKGVPPGPVREMPFASKKRKLKKKGRKMLSTISPTMKRLKKHKASSP
ncbi:unnamed protein product [Cuscuta europaea]|uniref:Ribosomal RNA processing protein 1 homolog n=1 Tax=Cuscuta europaea TaxID=41803 RepID=A0A9P0Z7X5_CUSEU|nr:unnamed protein product [Cuscuta europaea]